MAPSYKYKGRGRGIGHTHTHHTLSTHLSPLELEAFILMLRQTRRCRRRGGE